MTSCRAALTSRETSSHTPDHRAALPPAPPRRARAAPRATHPTRFPAAALRMRARGRAQAYGVTSGERRSAPGTCDFRFR